VTAAEREALRTAMKLPYPSFPCLFDKKPACPTGFKAAALPEMGLATLWARHPGVLVGVPTGPGSGVSVLDVDIAKSGNIWWSANKARLPLTRLHETRSGGLHGLFNHRAGLKCSVSKIAPGIDVRADGGYIIWWPASGLTVVDHPLADWPDWLTPPEPTPPSPPRRPATYDEAALKEAEAATMRGLRGAALLVERAEEGNRNAICFWAACRAAEKLRDGPLPPFVNKDWVFDLLALAAARAGLPAREANLTIASGLRRA
jgi:Bifunctional DNA primase/polymerase, N-terminal